MRILLGIFLGRVTRRLHLRGGGDPYTFLLNEDGTFVLNEDGSKIRLT